MTVTRELALSRLALEYVYGVRTYTLSGIFDGAITLPNPRSPQRPSGSLTAGALTG